MAKARIISKNVDLADLKKLKDIELSLACQNAIGNTFQSQTVLVSTSSAEIYSIDLIDQQNMSQKLILLTANASMTEVSFKVKGIHEFVNHTRNEFIAVVTEIGTHIENQRIKLGSLRIVLDNAKTEEEIIAISWN